MVQELTTSAKREVAQGDRKSTRSTAVYLPHTDIYETQDHVVLVADMPGVAPSDVDVNLERRVLTIRGRIPSRSHGGYRRVHVEYGEGDFERAFTLSQDIDGDRIEASHRNGVLTLKMPKAESAKTRKIAVKGA